jgi:hypothetical protein
MSILLFVMSTCESGSLAVDCRDHRRCICVVFVSPLPSVKKGTRQRKSLLSVKNKTLGKKLLHRVFSFTEGFLRGTRQRASLPSVQKKHLAKNMALGKKPNSGSVCGHGQPSGPRGSLSSRLTRIST